MMFIILLTLRFTIFLKKNFYKKNFKTNKIKGKYTIILKEYCLFEQEELNRFYSITYGKINIK